MCCCAGLLRLLRSFKRCSPANCVCLSWRYFAWRSASLACWSTNQNLSAARGRIVDAAFAKETANLARVQILQQAGMAMVAQANQIPQNVLQLLQG